MTQAVKRACDACHRRKVKCDGVSPCRNCSSAQLSCTYNAIPQKKGPKGSRAKVISELRETQRQTSLFAKVQSRMSGAPGSPGTSNAAPTPGLLTGEMVKDCLEFFFANLYPNMPILDRRQLEQQAMFMEQNREAYCLITALCAFVMLQPGMTMPAGDPYNLDMMPGATLVSSTILLEESLRVRRGYEYLDMPTLYTLATSYFIFACNSAVESHSKAWYYLREAATMIHMISMNKEDTYLQWDAVEAARRRRFYWLIYVTERAYAIQRHRPLTLQATINPPTMNDDPADPLAQQHAGFVALVNAFRPFDDALTSIWNKTRGTLSTSFLTSLQKQLNEVLPSYHCQDPQLTDIGANQQWLKTTVWQLTNRCLDPNDEQGISFQYPQELSQELQLGLASQFPGHGLDMELLGFVDKLVEVAFATTEVLSLKPASRDPFTTGPREHLSQILNIVSVLRHGDRRFLPLLLSKVSDALPRLTNPMLQNAPENSNLANIDIFDGFGNAGIVPPPQMHMAMEAEYERKFSVADYDKFSVSDMHSTPPDTNSTVVSSAPQSLPSATAADLASPFVSSPSILSPGMEFPHSLNDYACSPMQDMVISPIGGPGQGGGINPQQTQHQHQHHGISPLQSQCLNPQQIPGTLGRNGLGQSPPNISGINSQPLSNQIPTSHPLSAGTNGMMGVMARQPPQRSNSFVMQPQQPPIPRTVGDFHALQRASSDANSSMATLASMGIKSEIDFSTMR